MTVTVHHGDSRDVLKTLADASIDSVVCDPPYALVSIGKRFGADNAAPAQSGKTGAYARASAGFMGQKWDTGETAFDPLFWVEVKRVLKPGGHLIAFSGTRTYHRLACAIEDAGFEIRDMTAWVYASGFPKSHNVVRKLQESGLACSCHRTIISSHHVSEQKLCDLQRGLDAANAVSGSPEPDLRSALFGGADLSEEGRNGKAAAGETRNGVGELHGLRRDVLAERQALGAGTAADVLIPMQRRGARGGVGDARSQGAEGAITGELQGCGDEGAEEPSLEGRGHAQASARKLQGRSLRQGTGMGEADGEEGRLHHGAPTRDGTDVRLPADPDGSGQSRGPQPGEQSPEQPDALPDERGPQAWGGWPVCPGCLQPVVPEGYGTALKPAFEPICVARKPLAKGLTVAANVLAHGTGALNIDASRIESPTPVQSSAGSTGFGTGREDGYKLGTGAQFSDKGRWPANVIHDGSEEVVAAFPETASGQMKAGTPRKGQRTIYGQDAACGDAVRADTPGDSGSAARFFYSAKADAADRCGSKHPTVKPIDLMAYLCRLVTQPGGTVLDPFAGSGSTGMACLREGFDCILIEREAQYVADIHRRLAHVEGADTPLFSNDAAPSLFGDAA